jgi:aryl-alcohol dehydrogenase-like predicted oxidoreductase
MRYRPFGITGKAVSAVSLALGRGGKGPGDAAGWRNLMFAGMENGINCFDIEVGLEALEFGVAQALQAVERRLVFLIFTMRSDPRRPFTVEHLAETVKRGLARSSAGYIDVLMFDPETYAVLTPRARALLARLKEADLVLQLGVCGEADALDAAVADPDFEVLATPYNLTSEWKARRVLREASAAGMAAIGYDPAPADMVQPPQQPKLIAMPRRKEVHNPLSGVGTYAFLHTTSGWTPEALCVAYALTEPALATLQIDISLAGQLEDLACVPERDPPTGLGAQVEMARFGKDSAAERRSA